MNRKIVIVVGVVALVVIGLLLRNLVGPTSSTEETEEINQTVSTDDPLDIVLDFYDSWLSELNSDSSDPYEAGLLEEPLLSQALRDKLNASKEKEGKDPVICQDPLPTRVVSRELYSNESEAQMVVWSKDQPQAGQTIVTLKALNEGWYIHDIDCSKEFDEPGEFTFEAEGNLLRDSITAPYDSSRWHLIYAEDGVMGYVAPMFFDGESICVDEDGNEATCDENSFSETEKVTLKGNMTEAGVEVKRVETTE